MSYLIIVEALVRNILDPWMHTIRVHSLSALGHKAQHIFSTAK